MRNLVAILGTVVFALGMIGCAKKSDKAPAAPTDDKLGALKKGMKVKGGKLDGMTGNVTRAKVEGGYKLTATLVIGEALLEGTGIEADGLSGSAVVKKANVAVKAESDSDSLKAKGASSVEVVLGCIDVANCEGGIVYATMKYQKDGKDAVIEGGFAFDFHTANKAGPEKKVSAIKEK